MDIDPRILWAVSTVSAVMAGSGFAETNGMVWPVTLDGRVLRPMRVEFDPLKVIIDGDVLIEFDSDSLVMKCVKIAALCQINTTANIEVQIRGPVQEQAMLLEAIKRAAAALPTAASKGD